MGQRETPGNRFNQPIPLGTNVFDANGEKVGTVSGYHAQGEYLTIQKGWLLTHDIYVPFTRIGNVIASEVHLSLTKDELKEQRWATPPVSMPGSSAVGMGATTAPLVAEQGRVGPERVRTEDTRAPAARDEDLRLPIREEEFVAGKQAAETKHIHLHKQVVEEQATGSVPVTHEEVTIERIYVESGNLAADDQAFQEEDFDIPVKSEEAVGGKRVIAHEEVRIHKESVTEVQQVSGTVRKEHWRVEGAAGQDQEIPPHHADEQNTLGNSETGP